MRMCQTLNQPMQKRGEVVAELIMKLKGPKIPWIGSGGSNGCPICSFSSFNFCHGKTHAYLLWQWLKMRFETPVKLGESPKHFFEDDVESSVQSVHAENNEPLQHHAADQELPQPRQPSTLVVTPTCLYLEI
jgi:hypothetical protein